MKIMILVNYSELTRSPKTVDITFILQIRIYYFFIECIKNQPNFEETGFEIVDLGPCLKFLRFQQRDEDYRETEV